MATRDEFFRSLAHAYPRSSFAGAICEFDLAKAELGRAVVRNNARNQQADRFAIAFCEEANRQIAKWRSHGGRKPTRNSVSNALSANGFPNSRDALNTLSKAALQASRLKRLGLKNPFDSLK